MKTKKLSRILAIVLLLAMLILPTLCVNRDTRVFAQTGEIRYGDQLYNANARASTLNSEIVTYSRVSSETFYINGSYPRYHNENSSLTNACAPVGGSNIVGFDTRLYSRFYKKW